MNISDVKIYKVRNSGKLKAIASVTINDCIVIHNVRVVQGNDKLFVAMPNKPNGRNDGYSDIIHPIGSEAREYLEKIVLTAYENVMLNENEAA